MKGQLTMNKFLLGFGSVLGASSVFAQEVGGNSIDVSEASQLVTDISQTVKDFAGETLFPALIVVIGVAVGLSIALWAYRKIRTFMSAR